MSEDVEQIVNVQTGARTEVGYIKKDARGLAIMPPYPIGVRLVGPNDERTAWVDLADLNSAAETLVERVPNPA